MARKVWENWDWMVDTFAELGSRARVVTMALEQMYVVVDLGEGWGARITTASGNLRTYSPSRDPLDVAITGSEVGVPHDGYSLTWFPPTENVREVPKAIAPLLRRVAARPPAEPSVN